MPKDCNPSSPKSPADVTTPVCGPVPCPPTASPPVTGTPTPVSPNINSVVCQGGKLVVQNNNSGPDRACTQAHEENHVKDYKQRFGENLCQGVNDGSCPQGGDGWHEFYVQTECESYRIGMECRQNLLKTASDADKPAIQAAIERDAAQLYELGCF
jgi:hypothetical protein